jgi:hypothetical protein
MTTNLNQQYVPLTHAHGEKVRKYNTLMNFDVPSIVYEIKNKVPLYGLSCNILKLT